MRFSIGELLSYIVPVEGRLAVAVQKTPPKLPQTESSKMSRSTAIFKFLARMRSNSACREVISTLSFPVRISLML